MTDAHDARAHVVANHRAAGRSARARDAWPPRERFASRRVGEYGDALNQSGAARCERRPRGTEGANLRRAGNATRRNSCAASSPQQPSLGVTRPEGMRHADDT